jgi:hypothetical protein
MIVFDDNTEMQCLARLSSGLTLSVFLAGGVAVCAGPVGEAGASPEGFLARVLAVLVVVGQLPMLIRKILPHPTHVL